MVYQEGPITTELRMGAVLLLDELDVGHANRIMALQSVLEGKGVLIKATGELVKPAPGFQIFATGNTKGMGSESGQFIGTQILNAALRDRFAIMLFQDYPNEETETAILSQYFIDYMWISQGIPLASIPPAEAADGNEFIKRLCEWARRIRDTHKACGGQGEIVTTRSLINIVGTYSIFKDPKQAVIFACERFPDDVRDQFVQIYEKLNLDVSIGPTDGTLF
jgi:hypothetical protein